MQDALLAAQNLMMGRENTRKLRNVVAKRFEEWYLVSKDEEERERNKALYR